MAESIAALVQRVATEIHNEDRYDRIPEFYTEDCECIDPAVARPIVGCDELRDVIAGYRAAFPDYVYEVHDIVVDGDRVAFRWEVRGTHSGALPGMEASGRAVHIEGLALCELRDGRFCRVRQHWDNLGLMRQLGALPEGAFEIPVPD